MSRERAELDGYRLRGNQETCWRVMLRVMKREDNETVLRGETSDTVGE